MRYIMMVLRGNMRRNKVLYALRDFLISRLGSLLKHITYNNERSASYEKKRENHSIVRAFEP